MTSRSSRKDWIHQDPANKVEVREHRMGDEEGTSAYFVYWTTDSYVGSRGVGLDLAQAEALAERVRREGPDAL